MHLVLYLVILKGQFMGRNIDNYGRTIDYLRISVTDKCNLRCSYCMPEDGVCKKEHTQMLRNEEMLKIVKVAAAEGVKKIRLTGGEPLVRKGILDLIREINQIPGIEDICMTTNGILLKDQAVALKEAGLRRVNISLDTLDSEKYREITRGGSLEEAMAGIEAAVEAGMAPIKINTVLIGGVNDGEVMDFMNFAAKYQCEWRIIELMPIGEVSDWSADHFVSGQKLLEGISSLEPIIDTTMRRVKKFYNKDLELSVGLIDAISGKFCDSCNRLRLTSDGKIKPCLHSDVEHDVFPHLDDPVKLRDFYRTCVLDKPKEHHMEDDGYQPITRNMNRIGG